MNTKMNTKIPFNILNDIKEIDETVKNINNNDNIFI